MKARLLIAALCFAVVGCTLVDAPTGLNQVPDTGQATGVGYYVSPNGSAVGDGSKASPWDLQTALDQPGKVVPGDTIWMLGGLYKGDFTSQLKGTTAAPVVLREFPGERATIDGTLHIRGDNAWYWGFEYLVSDPTRVSQLSGSGPTDIPRGTTQLDVMASDVKLINLVIHDAHDGVFAGSFAPGLEIYGCIIYNNGWIGPDRSHGHGLYLQNRFETKRVIDNVIFNNFSTGLKIGGSGQAYLLNFLVDGNSIFENGAPARSVYGDQINVHLEGSPNMGAVTYTNNSIYHIDGNSPSVHLGQIGDAPDSGVIFRNNVVQGTSEFNEWKQLVVHDNTFTTGPTPLSGQARLIMVRQPDSTTFSSYDWNGNAYAAAQSAFPTFATPGVGYHDLTAWQSGTGWDASGTYTTGAFPGTRVIVRPNKYESGRAYITVWNWSGAPTVNVNVSGVLNAGDSYALHHVYDVFGPAIQSGTYSGKAITIQLKAFDPPMPIGLTEAIPSAGPEFNVFLLERR